MTLITHPHIRSLRALDLARRGTEEEQAEAFFLCERRRRRRLQSAMREQSEKMGHDRLDA
jgi:hypothetical protein